MVTASLLAVRHLFAELPGLALLAAALAGSLCVPCGVLLFPVLACCGTPRLIGRVPERDEAAGQLHNKEVIL